MPGCLLQLHLVMKDKLTCKVLVRAQQHYQTAL